MSLRATTIIPPRLHSFADGLLRQQDLPREAEVCIVIVRDSHGFTMQRPGSTSGITQTPAPSSAVCLRITASRVKANRPLLKARSQQVQGCGLEGLGQGFWSLVLEEGLGLSGGNVVLILGILTWIVMLELLAREFSCLRLRGFRV